jgi:hypothetical protein
MDLNRWLAGVFPLLALAMMLSGTPHAFGRTDVAHHIFGIAFTFEGLASWMRKGTTLEADIEASDTWTQQVFMAAFLDGAPMGPFASAPTLAAAFETRRSEIGSRVLTD